MQQLIREHARSKESFDLIQEQSNTIGPYVFQNDAGFIGQGGTGRVVQCFNSLTGETHAVKIVNKTVSLKLKEAKREVQLLQSLQDHPNIIKLHHVEEDAKFVYIFTEYCPGGDLYSYVKKNGLFNEALAKRLFRQMLEGIEFLHRKRRLCHHDIKLENFVLDQNFRVKLLDFGFAVELGNPQESGKKLIKSFDNSPAYSALEILLRKPHDETVDIFSLGTCLYYMLCGCFPFCDPQKTTHEQLTQNVLANKLEFSYGLGLSESVQDLIMRLLAKKNYRITLEAIRAHSWLL